MKAANFTLPSTNKKSFTLNESLGKYVVLYFYPKDDTPGCTIETIDFNPLVFCDVTAVIAVIAYDPNAVIVFISA